MALLKAAALGAIAAIGLPYLTRDQSGSWAGTFDVWAVQPIPGHPDLYFSIPVFLVATIFAWALFVWTEK